MKSMISFMIRGSLIVRVPRCQSARGRRVPRCQAQLPSAFDDAIAPHLGTLAPFLSLAPWHPGTLAFWHSGSEYPSLNRQIVPIAPFLPRSDVVANARIAEQPQCDVGVRGAVAPLAVRDHFAVTGHAGVGVHLLELGGWLEVA